MTNRQIDMKKNNLKDLHIFIEDKFKKEYKKYCIDNDYNMSERIREIMKIDLKGEIKKINKNEIY